MVKSRSLNGPLRVRGQLRRGPHRLLYRDRQRLCLWTGFRAIFEEIAQTVTA